VLLKDVFDYSMEETAELVNSTVGGVKAALNRARAKLASYPTAQNSPRNIKADPELARVMQLYIDRFNRRDWDGLHKLISADASLRVADAFVGRLADSPYFGNYGRWSMPRKLALGEVDGERAVIILRRGAGTWTPYGIVRLILNGPQIDRIADYSHCPWVIPTATSVTLSAAAP
jgi:RNA polymerase sigma-70 factor (ECF subfamily)